LYKYLTEKT
jgi:hypothetical protein